jgi:hypothetical protein
MSVELVDSGLTKAILFLAIEPAPETRSRKATATL